MSTIRVILSLWLAAAAINTISPLFLVLSLINLIHACLKMKDRMRDDILKELDDFLQKRALFHLRIARTAYAARTKKSFEEALKTYALILNDREKGLLDEWVRIRYAELELIRKANAGSDFATEEPVKDEDKDGMNIEEVGMINHIKQVDMIEYIKLAR